VKAGTIEKVKFSVLKNLLSLSKFQVIGILEGLWYFTAVNAQDGAIGKFTDLEIASWLEWTITPPDALIYALVTAKFVDRCATHRLVVHAWDEHCPAYLKGSMANSGKSFAVATMVAPKDIPKDIPKEPPKEASKDAPQGVASNNQVKSRSISSKSPIPDDPWFDAEFWPAYPRHDAKLAAKRAARKIKAADKPKIIANIAKRKLNGWENKPKEFIPLASTYLNGQRWKDESENTDKTYGENAI